MKPKQQGITKIHNVRFYNLGPRSINCLAYNSRKCKLAVSRGDASIEIWDISFAPYLEKVIVGSTHSSVEDLGWFEDRLFSAGLTGTLTEWNLTTFQPKLVKFITGSAIWCLDINVKENCIALGTEEGYLNLFKIDESELNYLNLFDKQEGRILCCKFDQSGSYIVTGSQGVIRIWNTKTGHAIHKISLSKAENKRETIVWSLQVMKDFTIISGDSRGQVTFWDGKLGIQIESHQCLKADVLTVALNNDENILICSGIDSILRIYALTEIQKVNQLTKKWVKYLQRNVHDHDVKALLCVGDKIISGGVDGYLGISSYSKHDSSITKHGPFLQHPCAVIANQAGLILFRYYNYLEMWKLGNTKNEVQFNDNEQDKRKFLSLSKGPEKMLELRSRCDEPIICCTLSSDGTLLIYSTISVIRIFSIQFTNSKSIANICLIKDTPERFSPSVRVIFSKDSMSLFCVKVNNQIDIFKILDNNEIDHTETVDASKIFKDTIHLIETSICGQYLVLAGTCKTIAIWSKQKKNWKHYLNLPKYIAPTTAIALHYNKPKLVSAFADGKIFEYDLEDMRFTCSTTKTFVTKSFTHCINGIVLDLRNENVIILHNDTKLFVIQKVESDDTSRYKSKVIPKIEEPSGTKFELKFHQDYEHFVHLAFLSEDEMVAVGVNPVSLIEKLPPTLSQKTFSSM